MREDPQFAVSLGKIGRGVSDRSRGVGLLCRAAAAAAAKAVLATEGTHVTAAKVAAQIAVHAWMEADTAADSGVADSLAAVAALAAEVASQAAHGAGETGWNVVLSAGAASVAAVPFGSPSTWDPLGDAHRVALSFGAAPLCFIACLPRALLPKKTGAHARFFLLTQAHTHACKYTPAPVAGRRIRRCSAGSARWGIA